MTNKKIWRTDDGPGVVVNKNRSVSRGTATYRAYHKLGLLTNSISEYDCAKIFDDAYDEFAKVLVEDGEMYIPVPMSDKYGIFDLYYAFRDAYSAFEELHPVWSKYKAEEFQIFDPGKEVRAHAMLHGKESVDGLYFTSKIVEKQKEEADKLMNGFEKSNPDLSIRMIDPAAYIALTAIRMELEEKPVDYVSYTRFISIEPREVNGKQFVPLARWSGDAMRFGWSSITSTFGDCGVRFTYSRK